MARPRKEDEIIIINRNRIILQQLAKGVSQAEVSRIFRLHRSVINKLVKNYDK